MKWSDDLQMFSRKHKIKCKQIIKAPMHPTTITDFVISDIFSLLFFDVESSLILKTPESKYPAVVTVTSAAMIYGSSLYFVLFYF